MGKLISILFYFIDAQKAYKYVSILIDVGGEQCEREVPTEDCEYARGTSIKVNQFDDAEMFDRVVKEKKQDLRNNFT